MNDRNEVVLCKKEWSNVEGLITQQRKMILTNSGNSKVQRKP